MTEEQEHRVRLIFERLRAQTAAPDDDALRAASRAASATARQLPRPRSGRRRWPALAIATALLAGSGLGFGLGRGVTPAGSAGTNMVGFGFLPARGWTIVHAELASPGTARAVAANVDIHPDDPIGAVPRGTIGSLPPHGVVIVATLRPRGDPERELRVGTRKPPLEITEAERVVDWSDPRLRRYRLAAGVGTYDVVVDVYLGAAQDLRAAEGQINRLVVASERVTIFARPTVVRDFTGSTLYGSVESGRAGEGVTIQAKDCGFSAFRVVGGATTTEGGGWSTSYWPRITTTVRAVWRNETSRAITVRQAAFVGIWKLAGGRLEVAASGRHNFWRKRIRVERFDRRLGRWVLARSLVLTESLGTPGSGPQVGTSGSSATFKPKLPKGTLVRAVLPLSQARPCYVAGVSRAVGL